MDSAYFGKIDWTLSSKHDTNAELLGIFADKEQGFTKHGIGNSFFNLANNTRSITRYHSGGQIGLLNVPCDYLGAVFKTWYLPQEN